MGSASESLLEWEGHVEIGREIALRAGVLVRCPVCDGIKDGLLITPDAAYRLGNHLITNHDPLVKSFDGDRRAMTDAVKKAVEDTGTTCRCPAR